MKKILEFIVMVLFIPFFFLPLIVMTQLSRYVFSVQVADVLAQAAPGQPCITYDDREYLTDIQDIHVTDEHIYLYYEAIHTVEVFRADGTCLCAIAFPEEKGHRGSELKGRGEEVHLLVNNDLYVFRGDELLAYYDNADYPGYSTERYLSWANSVSSRRRNAEGSYSLLGGVNVYRTDAAGERSVFLQRPIWLAVCTSWGSQSFGLLLALLHWLFIVPRIAKKLGITLVYKGSGRPFPG